MDLRLRDIARIHRLVPRLSPISIRAHRRGGENLTEGIYHVTQSDDDFLRISTPVRSRHRVAGEHRVSRDASSPCGDARVAVRDAVRKGKYEGVIAGTASHSGPKLALSSYIEVPASVRFSRNSRRQGQRVPGVTYLVTG